MCPALSRGKTCSGKHGHCSFRRGKHIQLDRGSATKAAATYPPRLGSALARELAYSRPEKAGKRIVIDLFAGSLAVTKQLRHFGIETLVLDSLFGTDVLTKGLIAKVCETLSSGQVYACMIAMPCSSFSLAQSRGGTALRSKSAPRGLPTNDLAKQKRIWHGNELLDYTIAFINVCNQHFIPYVLENPLSSYVWQDAKLQHVVRNGEVVDVHQCGFGARFRKATRLVFGNSSMNGKQYGKVHCRQFSYSLHSPRRDSVSESLLSIESHKE